MWGGGEEDTVSAVCSSSTRAPTHLPPGRGGHVPQHHPHQQTAGVCVCVFCVDVWKIERN